MSEKLQKVLARVGLGSRRALEEWIQEGRIKVNGKVANLGDRVTSKDKIHVDDRLIKLPQETETQILLYNKPEGEVCTRSDPEGRPTVFSNLPKLETGRWVAIGRLDINTSGLLIFTNDGELANRLMHPSEEVEREYVVRVIGEVDYMVIKRLLQGVELEDGLAKLDSIKPMKSEGRNQWYKVIVREGRNRLVRRLWQSQNVTVNRLTRIRYGEYELPRDLKKGEFRIIQSF